MKKIIVSLVAVVAATLSYAQSSMLATLSHEGEISTFYGQGALKAAHAAATHGDIITLSSGSFNAVNITKAVTIRGAGMAVDSTAQTEPTVITGDFIISIPDDVTERLTLEGIYNNFTVSVGGNLKNATFLKNRFNKIDYYDGGTATNLTMIHCRVSNVIDPYNNWTVSCVNCIINGMNASSNNNFEFLNCVVRNDYFDQSSIGTSSFKNCVLVLTQESYNYILSTSAVAYNCIGIGMSTLFNNIPNNTNIMKSYADVFKTYTGTYSDSQNFDLTETAKTTFIGIDGTEVGIYGGNMPFSPTPTNPQITKCNVAAKSTADGKLSVDITVNGAK